VGADSDRKGGVQINEEMVMQPAQKLSERRNGKPDQIMKKGRKRVHERRVPSAQEAAKRQASKATQSIDI
jgi:hypothetical protein